MRCTRPILTSLFTAALLCSSAALAQPPFGDNPFMAQQPAIPDIEYDPGGEFNFVRVQFDTWQGGGGGGWGYFGDGGPTWSIDFPGADMNFLRGVSRLTNIRVMRDPIVLRFDDERIFDYPFLYMLEVGQQGGIMLSQEEIDNVREYLLRGGFLLIDDFWGERQWKH